MLILLLRSAANSVPSFNRIKSVSASSGRFASRPIAIGGCQVFPRSFDRITPPHACANLSAPPSSSRYTPSRHVPSGICRTGAEQYQSFTIDVAFVSHVTPPSLERTICDPSPLYFLSPVFSNEKN